MLEINFNTYKFFGDVAGFAVYSRVHETYLGRCFNRYIATKDDVISSDSFTIFEAIEKVKQQQIKEKLQHEYWYQKAG